MIGLSFVKTCSLQFDLNLQLSKDLLPRCTIDRREYTLFGGVEKKNNIIRSFSTRQSAKITVSDCPEGSSETEVLETNYFKQHTPQNNVNDTNTKTYLTECCM